MNCTIVMQHVFGVGEGIPNVLLLWCINAGFCTACLVVRFSAAGHLEMAWHLYVWGHDVEVLAPERLREMVHAYRRSDFPSLP